MRKERYEEIAKTKQKLINKVLQNNEIDEKLATLIVDDIIAGGLDKNNTIVLGKGLTCRIVGEDNFSLGSDLLHYQLIYTNTDENGTKDYAYPKTTDDDVIELLIKKHQNKSKIEGLNENRQKINRSAAIITTLEKGSFKERRLARKITIHEHTNTFGLKELRQLAKIKESLYKIFLKQLSKEQAIYLMNIDSKLDDVITKFESRTGWIVTRDYVEKTDNYTNCQDPEFATHDTYRINRNENGFYLREEGAFNSYFARISETEAYFFANNKEILALIHELFSLKEYIMGGNFEVKDETIDIEYLNSIALYLGFKKIETTKKLNK